MVQVERFTCLACQHVFESEIVTHAPLKVAGCLEGREVSQMPLFESRIGAHFSKRQKQAHRNGRQSAVQTRNAASTVRRSTTYLRAGMFRVKTCPTIPTIFGGVVCCWISCPNGGGISASYRRRFHGMHRL